MSDIDVKVDTQFCGFGMDVANLRFEHYVIFIMTEKARPTGGSP